MLFMFYPPILWPLLTLALLFPAPRPSAAVINLAPERRKRGGAVILEFPGDNAA